MNNLPNYTSFQGVLDSIIRSYLLNELPPEVGESSSTNVNVRHSSAERDLGNTQSAIPNEILQNFKRSLQAQGFLPPPTTTSVNNTEVNNNNDGQIPGTSSTTAFAEQASLQGAVGVTGGNIDQQYIKALYQCFEKRGVFKELQTFLRHKLVSILQDEFPGLQQQSPQTQQNTIVFRLIEDFLRCHKLLYSLSVLASESDVKPSYASRALHGKLSSKEAEDLLDELGIKRLSRLSGQILKCYFDNEDFSLLESMHYLGVWLDGPSSSPLDIDQGKKRTSKKESDSNKLGSNKRKSVIKTTNEEESIRDIEFEGTQSVERRLVELEQRMEKEKDSKIVEAIEKFKEDDLQRYRKELETKMNLKMIEREKEYLIQMQDKLEDISEEVHQEKQGWLQVKLKQEKELCELRKQLTDKMISKAKRGLLPLNINEQQSHSPRLQKSKSYQQNYEDESEEVPTFRKPTSCIETIQMDKLAFLQYRLEQQDEEIKSLRRQLLLSTHMPYPSSSKSTPRAVTKELNRGGGDADGFNFTGNSACAVSDEYPPNGKLDDLEKFLRDSKARLVKLDTAASKVEEIFQEVTEKKRRENTTSLTEKLSSRLYSSRGGGRVSQQQSHFSPGVYNVEQNSSQISQVAFSLPNSITPLSRQQLPEKQVTFNSIDRSNPSLINNFDGSHYKRDLRPGSSLLLPPPPEKSKTRENLDDREVRQVQTPTKNLFPVSYGNGNRDKPGTLKTVVPARVAVTSDYIKESVSSEPFGDNGDSTDDEEVEVEESLFHMAAARQNVTEREGSHQNGNTKNNLQGKALHHGALSKEKVTFSDEDDIEENSKSISASESIRIKLANKSKEALASTSTAVRNNALQNGALSKSVVESGKNRKEVQQEKGQKVTTGETLPHFSRALLQEFRAKKLRSSSSSSSTSMSGTKRRAIIETSLPPAKQESHHSHSSAPESEEQNSSISISVPKSDDDEENNDFWKL